MDSKKIDTLATSSLAYEKYIRNIKRTLLMKKLERKVELKFKLNPLK